MQSKCGGRRCIPEKVPVIRLSEWLDQHVTNRQLPSTVYGLYSNGPQVVMKMDVEFQEFVLLPDMVRYYILSSTLIMINLIFDCLDLFVGCIRCHVSLC